MRKWNYIAIAFLAAAAITILYGLMPTIAAANGQKEDMQTYRSGYSVNLSPKQAVNFSHWVGYQQIVTIEVDVQQQDHEIHAVLTDSQGRMVLSKFFKGSLHETMRFGYSGPYAFVVSNGGDTHVSVQIGLESTPMSQYPQREGLPITLPADIIPLKS